MWKNMLITVLTYPTPSRKYIETVCTAGITEEGEWIRRYPIKLRMLKEKLHKYHWYMFNVEPRPANKDIRRESYFCISSPAKCFGRVGTENNWEERKKLCLRNLFSTYDELEKASDITHKDFISLATFKPKEVIDLIAKPRDIKEEERKKEEILKNLRSQGKLIEQRDIVEYWKMAQSIPYTFYYVFRDDFDEEITLMIEDWEIMMLYRKCRMGEGKEAEKKAIEKVRQKYLTDFKDKDLYFFMGTRRKDQMRRRKKFYSPTKRE